MTREFSLLTRRLSCKELFLLSPLHPPKGEDQHFRVLFSFGLSKPQCREAFSPRTERCRRQSRHHSTLTLGKQVEHNSRWSCHTQHPVNPSGLVQEGSVLFLKRTSLAADRTELNKDVPSSTLISRTRRTLPPSKQMEVGISSAST